jgi:hypothetical protein
VRAATEAMSCLESKSVISPAIIPRPLNQHKLARVPQLAHPTQPTDGRSACRASGLLEIPFAQAIGDRSFLTLELYRE